MLISKMEVASSSKDPGVQAKEPSPDSENGTSKNVLRYKKMIGFANTKGQDYEVTMAALIFIRALNSGQEFQLATNVQGAGALDDVVFRVKSAGGSAEWTTTFLQLKHKERSCVYRNALTNPKGDFSMPSYFKSYLVIKKSMSTADRETLFDGRFEDCQFVIFTNAKGNEDLGQESRRNFSEAEELLWFGSGSVFTFETDEEMLKCLGECGDERKKFLSRLRVFCGQPNANSLRNFVKEELKKFDKDKVSGLNIDWLCECFISNVKTWWETRNEILDENYDILQTAIQKVKLKSDLADRRVRLQTFSDQTKNNYVLPVEFEDTAPLEFGNGFAHVVSCENTCRLTLTKLLQAIDGQSLLLSCEQLTANKEALLAESQNGALKHLVVCTKDWRPERCSEYYEVVNEMLEDSGSVVFVSDNDSSVISELSEMFQERCKSYVDTFTISQLKEGSSRDKMLNKLVSHQGHTITLGTILNNECDCLEQVITASLVVDILENVGPLIVGSSLPEGIGYYVERTLGQALCVKASVFQELRGTATIQITKSEESERSLFANALDFVNSLKDSPSFNRRERSDIVCGLVQSPLSLDREDGEIFIGPKFPLGLYECNCVGLRFGQGNEVTALHVFPAEKSSKKVSFLFVADETNDEDVTKLSEFYRSRLLVSLKGGQLRWVQSHEDMDLIRKHIDEGQVSRFAPKTVMDVGDRLVLVCAEPGMGKSTLMARLAKNTKEMNPHYFVILIALNDHTKLFAEGKHADVLEFLSIAAKMDSPLHRSLLKFALEVSGNVVVIADGFDEIAPKYNEQSCHLLSSLLTKTKASKIWMTSRNSVKQIIETHFSKFSANLCEFDKADQKKFLKSLWAGKSSEDRLNAFIDHLLEKSAQAIEDKKINFLGIPLQSRMLAEVYEDHVTGSAEKTELPKLDLRSLVEQFIERKLNIFIRDKLKIANDNPMEEELFKMLRKDFFASHTNAALILILDDKDIRTLGMERIFTETVTFFNDIKLGLYKTGFIDEIVNDKPRFIHRTFAEYLVANWISQNFAGNLEYVQSKMFSPDFTVIRYFFDGILCKGRFLHTAVLQENVEQVKTLLESEDVDVEAQDLGGRTALHLAASLDTSEDQEENRRRCEILDLIIDKTSDFKVVDKVLCGSPMRYADITRRWSAIDKLLCKIDDNGELIVTLEDITDVKMVDTILKQDLDKLLEFCLATNRFVFDSNHLASACVEGSVKAASVLIDRIARNNRNNCYLRWPLLLAITRGKLEIVKLLLEKYVSTLHSSRHLKESSRVTKHSNSKSSKKSYKASNFINKKDSEGMSAMHYAAVGGHAEVIRFLISQGGVIQTCGRNKKTPLYFAVLNKQASSIRALLDSLDEADRAEAVNSVDKSGDNVLHLAAMLGSVECVELLVKAGGRVTLVSLNGDTPLMLAAWQGMHVVVEWLLENFNEQREGINLREFIDMKEKKGKTAWDKASNKTCREVIAYFSN